MRSRPATGTASYVDFLARLIRRSRGGTMLLARQRSRRSATFAEAGRTHDLAITNCNRCGDRQPIPTRKRDRGGGRNARATSTRSHAFPECPPAIHPRESPAAAGPAAIIRQAQKTLTFSLQSLSITTPFLATEKKPLLVQKLWTKTLPCGNPRKTRRMSGAPCLAGCPVLVSAVLCRDRAGNLTSSVVTKPHFSQRTREMGHPADLGKPRCRTAAKVWITASADHPRAPASA